MNEILLNNIIEKVRKDLCLADRVYIGFERLYVESPAAMLHLENDAVYLLVNEQLDVALTDQIIVASENNFVSFTKSTFESQQSFEKFRRYISVRTNSLSFTPFTLDFIKVKPFNNPPSCTTESKP